MSSPIPLKPFFLIRHGETVANAQEICAGGFMDTPLTENGIKGAEEVAKYLPTTDVKVSKIYHSPLIRTIDTAKIVNKALNVEMIKIDNLREQIIGEWQGMPWIKARDLIAGGTKPKGGESAPEFAERLIPVFHHILNYDPANELPPMIVAHGGTFRAFGLMHGVEIRGTKNTHLHYFEPNPSCNEFPWMIYCFDIEGDKMVRNTSGFYPPKFLNDQHSKEVING